MQSVMRLTTLGSLGHPKLRKMFAPLSLETHFIACIDSLIHLQFSVSARAHFPNIIQIEFCDLLYSSYFDKFIPTSLI